MFYILHAPIHTNYSGCFIYSMLPSTLTVSLKGKQCSSVEKLFLFIKDEKGNKLHHLTIYCTIIQWHFDKIHIFFSEESKSDKSLSISSKVFFKHFHFFKNEYLNFINIFQIVFTYVSFLQIYLNIGFSYYIRVCNVAFW